DGESAAHGQRVLGAEADGGGQDLPGGVALDGAVHAGKCLRAQLARGGGGQSYGGGCSVDRNRPVIAGHVPVELVVGIEIANRVRAAVVDEDGLGGIHRAGNVDLQLAVAAFAAALVLETLAGGIGNRFDVQKQCVVAASWARIVNGNGAIDSVEGTVEHQGDLFSDRGAAVAVDDDVRVEVRNAPVARQGRRRKCQREQDR